MSKRTQGRRLIRVYIVPEFICDLLAGCIMGADDSQLPRDVEICRAGYDFSTGQFVMVLEHRSFDMVRHGDVVPFRDVTLTGRYASKEVREAFMAG